MAIYSVTQNTPGYLPETDPVYFRTRKDAEEYAKDLVRDLREDGYTVTGSARGGYYHATTREKMYDLGIAIEIARGDMKEWDVDPADVL